MLKQTAELDAKRSAAALRRRAGLLALLPESFTLRQAVDVWHSSDSLASAQLQKMLRHSEIEMVQPRPAVYRKVRNGA